MTSAADTEVPDFWVMSQWLSTFLSSVMPSVTLELAESTLSPMARRSGFMRPSGWLPPALKRDTVVPEALTDPTVSAFLEIAGEVTKPGPLLPAATTTKASLLLYMNASISDAAAVY